MWNFDEAYLVELKDPATLHSSSVQDPGAPPPRTALLNHPTLIISWWCTGCALATILIRLWGRFDRAGRLFREDKVMALSIIPLLIRMALIHPVLLFGTNNVQTDNLTPRSIYRRSIGARLVLASRIFYAMFIWVAKFTVSEYLKRLTEAAWKPGYERVLKFIRIFLFVSFFAVVVATLAECHPFSHYWQVVPDPGPRCRNGYAQLLVMGTADILTDCLLIAFPIPIIVRSSLPFFRKLGVIFLFGLNSLLIAIAAYRMPTIIALHGLQQRRTLWASIEILAATAISNGVVLASFLRDRGIKKVKYDGIERAESAMQSGNGASINRTMTRIHWGNDSDEELFSHMRGRMGSAQRDEETAMSSPRPTLLQISTTDSARPSAVSPTIDSTLKSFDFASHITTKAGAQERNNNNNDDDDDDDRSPAFADAGGLLGPVTTTTTTSTPSAATSTPDIPPISPPPLLDRLTSIAPPLLNLSDRRRSSSKSVLSVRRKSSTDSSRFRNPSARPEVTAMPSLPSDDVTEVSFADAGGLLGPIDTGPGTGTATGTATPSSQSTSAAAPAMLPPRRSSLAAGVLGRLRGQFASDSPDSSVHSRATTPDGQRNGDDQRNVRDSGRSSGILPPPPHHQQPEDQQGLELSDVGGLLK